jgi:hypothetical protein
MSICFITAIFGNYEASCKKFVRQSISTDFICFTDNPNILSNDWIIDNTPYHYTCKNPLDKDCYINSLSNNQHTFNIAKYYKQSFHLIPRLKDYDVIVWIDGTIEITNEKTSYFILNNIIYNPIITWKHEYRTNLLLDEVIASNLDRYYSPFYFGQSQPIQNVKNQYITYTQNGFKENYGVWLTCFIAFNNNHNDISTFLNLWFLQTLKFTTQDQVSFPYVCQKLDMRPLTIPDFYGPNPHNKTIFYIKHNHGK